MNKPTSIEVLELRRSIQTANEMGITEAQDACARLVHTSRRAWQQWERGERGMHPAFWELAQVKNSLLN